MAAPFSLVAILAMLRSIELACCQSVPLFRSGNRVVITYGNGPQVDNLLVQQVLDKILRVEGIQRDVVTLVSQGAIVIAGGGGGIPVILEPDGS